MLAAGFTCLLFIWSQRPLRSSLLHYEISAKCSVITVNCVFLCVNVCVLFLTLKCVHSGKSVCGWTIMQFLINNDTWWHCSVSLHRLWAVCILWGLVWHLLHDHSHRHCNRPLLCNYPTPELHWHAVWEEGTTCLDMCLGVFAGLEPTTLLWLEWVLWGRIVIDFLDSNLIQWYYGKRDKLWLYFLASISVLQWKSSTGYFDWPWANFHLLFYTCT